MKRVAILLAVALSFWLGHHARGGEPPAGCCRGGYHPASACKTCQYCYYCGKKGRWGKRPQNSATCVVCAPDEWPAESTKGKKP